MTTKNHIAILFAYSWLFILLAPGIFNVNS